MLKLKGDEVREGLMEGVVTYFKHLFYKYFLTVILNLNSWYKKINGYFSNIF